MNQKPEYVGDSIVVTMDYDLWNDEGELIDTSREAGPLLYLHGHGQLVPGLEYALVGMAITQETQVLLSPDEAYGPYDSEAVEIIPHADMPDDLEFHLGQEVLLEDETSGEGVVAYVTEVRPDGVVLDLNHPLAGETLRFRVQILDLRVATAEELAHGHAHEEDDHHHGD